MNNTHHNITVTVADITTLHVDAIVNAANETLLGGGGVDGAIHRAAGPELLEECRGLGGCATGEAKITAGYRLPARYIIHTVGPVWHGGGRHEAARLAAAYANSLRLAAAHLAAAYANSLRLAAAHHVRSIAFPCISTGIYGYPAKEAATIALNTVRDTLPQCPSIEKVIFCCFSEEDAEIYRAMV